MTRTTIVLPEPLKFKLQQKAKEQGLSFGEMVRRVLGKFVQAGADALVTDPFLSSRLVFEDPQGLTDVSENHDAYLYGPAETQSVLKQKP